MEATRVNNISVVELLVRVPGTVSQRELDVSLVAAAKAKSTECARILLDAGADANIKVPLSFCRSILYFTCEIRVINASCSQCVYIEN